MESELAVREGVKHLILTDKKINEQKAQIPMVLVVGAVNSKLINQGIRGFVSINIQKPFIKAKNKKFFNN